MGQTGRPVFDEWIRAKVTSGDADGIVALVNEYMQVLVDIASGKENGMERDFAKEKLAEFRQRAKDRVRAPHQRPSS